MSQLGDWAARVALAVLVLDRTGSAALTSLTTAVSLLPWVGLGQVIAAWGDRYPRRAVMIYADLIRAAAFGLMCIEIPVWSLLALAFLGGCATPPFEAARAATMPNTVSKDVYPAAIALTGATYQVAILLGALAGGGLIAVAGARGALALNAATFLASAVTLSRLRTAQVPAGGHNRSGVRQGWRAVFGDQIVRRALANCAVPSACAVVIESLVPVYVVGELREPKAATGIFVAAIPVGTLIATVATPLRGTPSRLLRVSAVVGLVGSSAALAGFAADLPVPWILAAFFCAGAVFASGIPANAVMGLRIADEVRASAFGVLAGLLQAALAGGAALGGVIAAWLGVRLAFVGALALGAGFSAWTLLRPVDAALDVRAPAESGDGGDVEADRPVLK